MAEDSKRNQRNEREPDGLGENQRGPASEVAHEQGWDLNEDKKREQSRGRPDHYGGKDYDYGAQDFGDTPATRDTQQDGSDNDVPKDRKAS